MTNEKVKEEITEYLGKKVMAKVDVGRNKFEYHEGIILNVYPFLFTLKVGNEIKSFSYADVLTKNIIVKLI